MVSEKVIVLLLIVAIVLSIVSVVVTFSANLDDLKPNVVEKKTPDSSAGQVSLIVEGNNEVPNETG